MKMKNKSILLFFYLFLSLKVNAQVYQYDEPVVFPTQDLYDTESMMMLLHLARERSSRRGITYDTSAYEESYSRMRHNEYKLRLFEYYYTLAEVEFYREHWDTVITNCYRALDTGFYNSDIYYLRGFALESKGLYSAAKKDYKRAKKYGRQNMEKELLRLKEKSKVKKNSKAKHKTK